MAWKADKISHATNKICTKKTNKAYFLGASNGNRYCDGSMLKIQLVLVRPFYWILVTTEKYVKYSL